MKAVCSEKDGYGIAEWSKRSKDGVVNWTRLKDAWVKVGERLKG